MQSVFSTLGLRGRIKGSAEWRAPVTTQGGVVGVPPAAVGQMQSGDQLRLNSVGAHTAVLIYLHLHMR